MNIIHMGVGGFGHHWSKVLTTTDTVTVTALVDSSQEALDKTCKEFDYDPNICFTSLETALEQVDADILLCVTPPQVHREHATQAMQAGLHVICEKPLASTIEDCVAMLQASRDFGRKLVVSQNYRYRPAIQTMARLVREGVIGKIGQVKIDFYKGWYFDSDNFRQSMPHPLIIDMCIHHFDLLRFVTGLEPLTVRGESWNPHWSDNEGDTSTMLFMVLENGARFVYTGSWCAQGDFSDWNGNWLIEGEKGSIVYSHGKITLNHAAGRYTIDESESIEPDEMVLSEQSAVLDRFITAIKNDTRPETDVSDNLRSISTVFAAVEAADSGAVMPILSSGVQLILAS
jgi:predicted dehydrogenase